MVVIDKPEVDQTDTTLLVEEFAEIYTTPTPTPKGWHGAKKESNLYWLIGCLFTIAEVQYLYPESKHESYLITTHYNLWHKRNIPNLR